jgi:hypothetical protein
MPLCFDFINFYSYVRYKQKKEKLLDELITTKLITKIEDEEILNRDKCIGFSLFIP